MKYYEINLSCGEAAIPHEVRYYRFLSDWTEEDIKWFFHEEAIDFAQKYKYLAKMPSPQDYEYEEDYEDALEKALIDWELNVEEYSYYEEMTEEEWNEVNNSEDVE